ncbi:sulfatase [endosymbiont of Acanthamoeba sp. UWC8]|uniref:LTA synthase family protein n=1 Tax=endosymbiont of Acanthamoeba sp. UWC8 TaxID=86106 RepID=UPI0004D169C3|nr:alkaline phosphatase family protein [endosymbiont of Acanthamoeba sp. UWC8]AIF81845.1 sulfatase [endosymbiont of Acanthamoeba sp. UWC8]
MLFKRLLPYISLYFLIETLLRISLLIRSLSDIDYSFTDIAKVFVIGYWFDLATLGFFLIPIILYHISLPSSKHGSRFDQVATKVLCFIFTFILLFDAVAEHIFWSEFNTRFNFIAVDYLVYTSEVIGNIIESFPIYRLIAALIVVAFFLTWLSTSIFNPKALMARNFSKRLKSSLMTFSILLLTYFLSSVEQANFKNNAEATEIASNGIHNLFHAFWNNEIDYNRFYAKQDDNKVNQNIRKLLTSENTSFIDQDITRIIKANTPIDHKNIMLVVMESMSAEYMQAFGNNENLTPNLDRLANEGLFFTKLYATGTRTVRGLEAITLSIPPTPGQSIVRRGGNENLFSLGFILKDHGYDTKFIYGGFGYFDNMNAFFSVNGFDVVDRTNLDDKEVQFANIWGVCDEDLFKRAIVEADKSYTTGNKFMQLIMTTSNHRPFTYPEGKIDIPSHSGRSGGVKYADYSVGKLIESAKEKPWFNDTIFVFISDHTAGAGGKVELNLNKYHIPMIIYAPNSIKPQKHNDIASQIDLAPTLLGLMNFSYYTKFFGKDLLNSKVNSPYAFISNYQKVAMMKDNKITVLAPKSSISQYTWPNGEHVENMEEALVDDTIAYYQSASKWREVYGKIPTPLIAEN